MNTIFLFSLLTTTIYAEECKGIDGVQVYGVDDCTAASGNYVDDMQCIWMNEVCELMPVDAPLDAPLDCSACYDCVCQKYVTALQFQYQGNPDAVSKVTVYSKKEMDVMTGRAISGIMTSSVLNTKYTKFAKKTKVELKMDDGTVCKTEFKTSCKYINAQMGTMGKEKQSQTGCGLMLVGWMDHNSECSMPQRRRRRLLGSSSKDSSSAKLTEQATIKSGSSSKSKSGSKGGEGELGPLTVVNEGCDCGVVNFLEGITDVKSGSGSGSKSGSKDSQDKAETNAELTENNNLLVGNANGFNIIIAFFICFVGVLFV